MRKPMASIQILKPSRPYLSKRALATVLIGFLLVLGQAVMDQGKFAAATEVVGDDERDLFIGSGSLLLPPGISNAGRSTAASCPGCRWRAVQTCDPTTPTACRGAARLCPHDGLWLKIYMAPPGADWQIIGSDCFTSGGPISREYAERELHQRVAEAVPALRPTMRPPGGILVHLPVLVDSGQQAGARRWNWQILGLAIQVEATPTWWWRSGVIDLGPTADPKASFVYRSSGTSSVEVATTWAARYWVDGLGPLIVKDPVRQGSTIEVSVGEARAVLVR
jgi:hypothetical protein